MNSSTYELIRTPFITSRALDFCSEKELIAQCGHEPEDWPLVVLKELVDNALDACEEAGVQPVVNVTVDERGITVTDNGPGIPESTVRKVTDFAVRVSSREAYVAPDRGKQGNALKTILAMPFVLDGDCGNVEIATGGKVYHIEMRLDRVRSEPVVNITTEPANVQNGTSVTVDWPDSARCIFYEQKARFVHLAENAAILNPHLSLTVDWYGERVIDIQPADINWQKWKPNNPTSAHWYETENLARLIGAYISNSGQEGECKTLREFIGEFRGLARTSKQKTVATACGLPGETLSSLIHDDQLNMQAVEKLLTAMREHSAPVKPRMLGIIGRDRLQRQMQQWGCDADTFEYRKAEGAFDQKGVPWVFEAAFAVKNNAYEYEEERRLVMGVNWSPSIGNPFRQLGYQYGLESFLTGQRAGCDEPVVIIVHLACPRIDYMDRGKSTVRLRPEMQDAMRQAVESITAKWCRQRKAEEREASRAANRREQMSKPRRRWTQVDAAEQLMERAYMAASAGGTLPAHARQIMYQARGPIQDLIGKPLGGNFDTYFCQTLLPNYIAAHPETTGDWDVVFDARGNLTEPHTKHNVPLGTLPVRKYLRGCKQTVWDSPGAAEVTTDKYPTAGPRNRYGAILFVEKEGFTPLFEKVELAERYDVAIMSTKGMSVVASRKLVDELCAEYDIPLLVVRDFDKAGFIIAGTLARDTRRYEFSNADHADRVIDLGLRLTDVQSLDLPAEDVFYGKTDPRPNLLEYGATDDEVEFLCQGSNWNKGGYFGQRVELNAMTSDTLLEWLEGKLNERGISKVIPDDATLEQAYRRAVEAHYINEHSREIIRQAAKHAEQVEVPADLRAEVEKRLRENPRTPWDKAVGRIAGSGEY